MIYDICARYQFPLPPIMFFFVEIKACYPMQNNGSVGFKYKLWIIVQWEQTHILMSHNHAKSTSKTKALADSHYRFHQIR